MTGLVGLTLFAPLSELPKGQIVNFFGARLRAAGLAQYDRQEDRPGTEFEGPDIEDRSPVPVTILGADAAVNYGYDFSQALSHSRPR